MSGLTGDWDKIDRILNPARVRSAMTRATAKAGVFGEGEVRRGIQSGAPGGQTFQPLHWWTIARKGSTKPLIDNGDLIGSITHEAPDDSSVWIGVKRSAKDKEGKPLVNIAAVHEFGCVIGVTEKMRYYLRIHGLYLKKTTTHIVIPPRPFLHPVLEDEKFQQKIKAVYFEALRGVFAS